MAVGLLHDGGRITRCVHVLFNDSGQEFKVRGGCGGLRLRKIRGRRAGRRSGNFIQTDCNRLAEIHRWLVGMRRNLNEGVAPGEVLAGEAVFFRTEDEGDAAAAGHLLPNERSQVMQFDHRLLGLAIGECSCSEDERAVPDGFGERPCPVGIFEHCVGADRGASFVPVRFVRRDHGELREAKVGQGACGCADIERVSRRDENHAEAIALGLSEQELRSG